MTCEICKEVATMSQSQLHAILMDDSSGATSWKLHALAELVRRKMREDKAEMN